MRIYADTSFLVKLLSDEPGGAEAVAEYRRLNRPRLFYLPLHALEVENAIRHRAFHARHIAPSSEPFRPAFYILHSSFCICLSRWPSSTGSGLQNRSGGCNSRTGLQFHPSIGVERYTLMAVRKDLPSRNTGRDTLMLDHFPRLNPICRHPAHSGPVSKRVPLPPRCRISQGWIVTDME